MTDEIAQALRRSHCSHSDRGEPSHQCIGTCLITRDGVTLDCKACGKDDRAIAPSAVLPEAKLVRLVLDEVGIEYDALTPERKQRAANAAKHWMATRR